MSPAPLPLGPEELTRLLAGPDPVELPRQADRQRRLRYDRRAWYGVLAHLDAGAGATCCPMCGVQPRPGAPWASSPPDPAALAAAGRSLLAPPVTDLHVLLAGAAGMQPPLLAMAHALQSVLDAAGALAVRPTVQLGTASELMARIDAETAAAGVPDADRTVARATALRALRAAGLRVVSEGTHPVVHPTRGPVAAARWEQFWSTAAQAGIAGHASVLYGPHAPSGTVIEQLTRLADLQRRTRAFVSVAPAGEGDTPRLTAGLDELKVLAACRLALPEVPHVRWMTATGDLKMAQLALACGADDLEGHIALAVRDRRGESEADDLTLPELQRWLSEEGFTPVRRNGIYEEE